MLPVCDQSAVERFAWSISTENITQSYQEGRFGLISGQKAAEAPSWLYLLLFIFISIYLVPKVWS